MAFNTFSIVPVLLVAVLVQTSHCQFQLSFGNPTPAPATTPRPTLPGGYDPACKDAIPNCDQYGSSSCTGVYQSWAKYNCESTCGFCKPLPTAPPPCVDALPDCSIYEDGICTRDDFRPWAKENCRQFCKFCTVSQLAQITTTQATTLPPYLCKDKVDCNRYGRDACSPDKYGNWGRENCALYCGFCQGIATPPPLCKDNDPNCALYQSDLCTNSNFNGFVEGNCMKHCGRC